MQPTPDIRAVNLIRRNGSIVIMIKINRIKIIIQEKRIHLFSGKKDMISRLKMFGNINGVKIFPST
jgi:hypothetical protein